MRGEGLEVKAVALRETSPGGATRDLNKYRGSFTPLNLETLLLPDFMVM